MKPSGEYSTYRQWKGWDREAKVKASDSRYFDGEMKRAGLAHARLVLEVGFGTGVFLSWAKARGIHVVGLEIIPELIGQAAALGHEVHLWNLLEPSGDTDPLEGRQFDAVVAWDVLEHLTVEEARQFLARVAAILSKGGRIVTRFPNGESPFYLPVQNGDYTHKMHVTRVKLEHLCIGSGLRVESYSNAFRVADRPALAWAKRLTYLMRDLVEIVIGYVYYGQRRPLDPVATAVLVRE
jgi:SAM-dependent methyltransferase